jgi:hypothetical protein
MEPQQQNEDLFLTLDSGVDNYIMFLHTTECDRMVEQYNRILGGIKK